ncbi:hypothetical protein [Nitrospirillum sp. BR 11828]|uniref:hypothetical protein n=1 Tax=Nitrospirillum sp. BR 11828 TaxID=3104325 RepID=UPI002ACA604C|nr:hypothetical protein [Nitrospirillum sp. BR 11828]MDZ5647782.1 hypothetical protein [Nitrospirillum sp. BR 11828]
MKILIDVDALETAGLLAPETAAMLRTHAVRGTGTTAINALLALGVVATAAGINALLPRPSLTAIFGTAFILSGSWFSRHSIQWRKLGAIWMVVGALVLSAALAIIIQRPLAGSLVPIPILLLVGWYAGSRLLIGLVPLAIAAAIGGSTGYWHAVYEISVQEPSLTIVLFTLLGWLAWHMALRCAGKTQALAIVFARVCVVLVNLGFWIGSLWGDTPGRLWDQAGADRMFSSAGAAIPPVAFAIAWAMALLAAGAWAASKGRNFLVNTVATFAVIHMYTQWFERLGLTPISVTVGGLIALAVGFLAWHYNRQIFSDED